MELDARGAQTPTPQQLDNVVRVCKSAPGHTQCQNIKRACLAGFGTADRGAMRMCQRLGYTPASHAKRQLDSSRKRCRTAIDGPCVKLRTACREERVTCSLVTRVACRNASGVFCDRNYLCTSEAFARVCAGTGKPGSEYQFAGISYTTTDEQVGASILSLDALVHGQSGKPGIGLAHAGLVSLGWLRDPNGFAYDAQVLMGVGHRRGSRGMAGLVAGGGFSGIADGHIGFGWTVSVEAFAVFNLQLGAQILGFIRPAWVFSEDARKDGSDTLSFADELTLGVVATTAPQKREGNFVNTQGYGISLFIKEQLGIRMFGISIGTGFSDASD